MKIGLAMSGGGIRATIFHLGVLGRLATNQMLQDVSFISTVSGGSLCAGLVYSLNGYQWPSDKSFIENVCPTIRSLLTSKATKLAYIKTLALNPWSIWQGGANSFAKVLRQSWNIGAKLQDIPNTPRWVINATTHENGKEWRFTSKRMGDYDFGYVENPDYELSDALAASAGFPFLIGPLVLDTSKHSWVKFKEGSRTETYPIKPKSRTVHLWDGALYDNLGLEALFKPNNPNKLRDEIDFLIVSDAAQPLGWKNYRGLRSARRIIDITADQVRSLRARYVVDLLINKTIEGRYLKIGNESSYILRSWNEDERNFLCSDSLSDEDVHRAASMKTTIRKVTDREFEYIYRHGYEVTDFTLHAYGPTAFPLLKYLDHTS